MTCCPEWRFAMLGLASHSTCSTPCIADRKQIEEQTTTWDKTVVDRTSELGSWVDFCYQMRKRGVIVFAYANSHYAGHAPATVKQFQQLWQAKGLPE
jgi:uncharacterized protein YecE (DUF72 family)